MKDLQTKIEDIKYRAWDKEYNRMCEVIQINFSDKFVNIIYFDKLNCEEIPDFNVPFSKVELMECLGVKDKKGKEIWEGDIVNLIFPESKEFTLKMASIFGVVYWNEEDAYFDVKQISKDFYQTKYKDYVSSEDLSFHSDEGREFVWEWVEIVGNIYDNKKFYEEQLEKYKLRDKKE